MNLLQAAAGFAAVAGLVTIIPGLDTALVLRAALTQRRRTAFWTAAGISAGVLIWGISAAIGLAALLAASHIGYDVVRYLGAIYLAYLGIRLIVRAVRSQPVVDPASGMELGATSAFRRGVLTNLLNPKVGVFYIATLPQFLVNGVPPLAMGALLASVHVALGLAWFGALIALAGAAARWLRRPIVARSIDAVTGVVLITFGIRTALEAR